MPQSTVANEVFQEKSGEGTLLAPKSRATGMKEILMHVEILLLAKASSAVLTEICIWLNMKY